jgi:hypothetical protein
VLPPALVANGGGSKLGRGIRGGRALLTAYLANRELLGDTQQLLHSFDFLAFCFNKLFNNNDRKFKALARDTIFASSTPSWKPYAIT